MHTSQLPSSNNCFHFEMTKLRAVSQEQFFLYPDCHSDNKWFVPMYSISCFFTIVSRSLSSVMGIFIGQNSSAFFSVSCFRYRLLALRPADSENWWDQHRFSFSSLINIFQSTTCLHFWIWHHIDFLLTIGEVCGVCMLRAMSSTLSTKNLTKTFVTEPFSAHGFHICKAHFFKHTQREFP